MTTTDIISTHLVVNVYEGYSQFFSGARQTSEMHIAQSSCVQSCYHSGSSWYRVWSDGHIEQGGKATNVPTSGTKAVSLPMPYSNTNYAIFLTISSFTQIVLPRITSKSSSSFDLDFQGGGLAGDVFWYAIGN